jgi:hypothetical protein
MFERFKKHFSGSREMDTGNATPLESAPKSVQTLLKDFAGRSFENGLYRVLVPVAVPRSTTIATEAFPDFRGRILCFAYDWLGRFFAVESTRLVNEEPAVLILEPGTGEALEVPCDISNFHDYELVDHADAALASTFFAEWLRHGNAPPKYGQCVGYKRHLYLGGEDSVRNLELIDLEVYWGIAAQLLSQTKRLPVGTKIGQIKLG